MKDPEYLKQLELIMKNYPDVVNPNSLDLVEKSVEEILILNNICSGCVALNYIGRGDVGGHGDRGYGHY